MDYYSAMKRNEMPIQAIMWLNLGSIMPSERSLSPKMGEGMIPESAGAQRESVAQWL